MTPYPIIKLVNPVGSGVTESWWASVLALLKHDSPDDPFCVANELICGQLGQFVGLPIPPCGLFLNPASPAGVPWFGTPNFNRSGDELPPADSDECVAAYSDPAHPRPDVVSGLVVFDAWIANGDRHVKNLVLDTDITPSQLHVFDHSWGLYGRDGAPRLHRLRDELGLAESSSASGNRHCLLDSLRTNARFRFWLGRLAQIPDFAITDAVNRAFRTRLVDGSQATAAIHFLQYRRTNLARIIQTHRGQFAGIPDADWGDL